MLKKLLVVIGCTLFAAQAYAIPITSDFDGTGTGSISNSGCSDCDQYTDLVNAVSLLVRGYKNANLDGPAGTDRSGSFGDREDVHQDTGDGSRGLGVDSDGSDSTRLDGSGPDEALRFWLSAGGTLTRIVFNNWGSSDDFDLLADGINVLDERSDGNGIWNGAVTFANSFAIGADGGNDNFRVRSITVDVRQVPETATLALLGAGLLGLGMRRRTRR